MRWIVTDNVYEETWRRLLEFANSDLTTDKIRRRHGEPRSKSDRANYAKQAAQARLCVLQAKEYFDSARQASLFTSPNHAYYGATSLASLLLLVLGDGTRSLDVLRKDNRNAHHGLAFTTGATASTATRNVTLLEQSRVEILQYGHLPNLYQVLPKRGNIYAHYSVRHHATTQKNYRVAGGYDVPDLSTLVGKKYSAIQILRYLPDLSPDLDRIGILVPQSRLTYEIEEVVDRSVTHTWSLHGCRTQAVRDLLLERFSVNSANAEALKVVGTEDSLGGIVILTLKIPTGDVGITWPTSRETINHDTYCYADAPETHELVDLYLVAFQLSMLSRYFPDIWVACIDSQCRGAKLIERVMEVFMKKFPILALSMLEGEDVVISTHREPWKE